MKSLGPRLTKEPVLFEPKTFFVKIDFFLRTKYLSVFLLARGLERFFSYTYPKIVSTAIYKSNFALAKFNNDVIINYYLLFELFIDKVSQQNESRFIEKQLSRIVKIMKTYQNLVRKIEKL